VRVIVALPDQQNEFQLLQAQDARATARRLGFDLEILDANANPVQQVHEVLRAIHTEPRPTAVIVEPLATDVMESVARKTGSLGVAWVMMNSSLGSLDSLRREYPRVPITSLGSDQVEIGRVQGRQLESLLPSGGNMLYIHGPQLSPAARERFEGLSQVVGPDIRLTIVDGQWSEESAETAVKSWLRLRTWEKTPIHAVAAQDDSMARGARRAIEAAPGAGDAWKGVHFLGIDGLPIYGQKLVDEGRLSATVIMPSNTGPALELIDRWVKSGALPPASVRLPVRSYPPELPR
jgi:ABC-type sugar transport system substrate-binding protein